MAQFLVLVVKNNDVPGMGEAAAAQVYRGDHADEAAAADVAADVFSLETGSRLWVGSPAAFTRYVTTTTTTRDVAAG